MIQRIQTLYLIISIICLAAVSFGMAVLNMEDTGFHGFVSAYGKTILTHEGETQAVLFRPLFIIPLVLILLCAWTIFSYKKLKFQLQLGRLTFLLYTFTLAMLLLYNEIAEPITKGVETVYTFAPGFYVFTAGLPFVFLANLAIRKDKKLLDSLNRLR
ncbi:MAG: hypothetical protein K0R65_1253 [Crocinitomicaceae bacterium]|jgi:hypothetical protein|nr:hypothetical protein [Crocinitomicaceae bacterium]